MRHRLSSVWLLAFAFSCSSAADFSSTDKQKKIPPAQKAEDAVPDPAPVAEKPEAVAEEPAPTPQLPAADIEVTSPDVEVGVTDGFVKTVEVAVNFDEDVNGDRDFNDAVICFRGEFNVSDQAIISRKSQKIQAELHNLSGCRQDLQITINRNNVAVFSQKYFPRETPAIELEFQAGDSIHVDMIGRAGSCFGELTKSMTNPDFGRIEATCNNTGG